MLTCECVVLVHCPLYRCSHARVPTTPRASIRNDSLHIANWYMLTGVSSRLKVDGWTILLFHVQLTHKLKTKRVCIRCYVILLILLYIFVCSCQTRWCHACDMYLSLPASLDLYMIIGRLHGYSTAIGSPINHVDDIKMRIWMDSLIVHGN